LKIRGSSGASIELELELPITKREEWRRKRNGEQKKTKKSKNQKILIVTLPLNPPIIFQELVERGRGRGREDEKGEKHTSTKRVQYLIYHHRLDNKFLLLIRI
jgi:hypothetical protein